MIKSSYRGAEFRGTGFPDLKSLYDRKGYNAERDNDYNGKHDFWQHAEFYLKKMKNID